MRVRTFKQDRRHRIKAMRLPAAAHAVALRRFVNVCADTVICDRKRRTIYLAVRRAEPARGLVWVIGGSVMAGELLEAAAQRKFKLETGLTIALKRFRLISDRPIRQLWSRRQQRPRNAGADDLSYTFALELSARERRRAALGLDPVEYEAERGLQEYDRRRLADERVHPVILAIYDDLFPA